MAGREPVKRWGSINHEVSLLLMVMLAAAIRLKQDNVLEAMASTLTMMLSLCSSSICIRSTCLITSSLRTSLSKSSPSVMRQVERMQMELEHKLNIMVKHRWAR